MAPPDPALMSLLTAPGCRLKTPSFIFVEFNVTGFPLEPWQNFISNQTTSCGPVRRLMRLSPAISAARFCVKLTLASSRWCRRSLQPFPCIRKALFTGQLASELIPRRE